MTMTGRVPLLLLLGVPALFVRPAGSTALWWVVAVLVLVVLDRLLTTGPTSLRLTRRPVDRLRQGETTLTFLPPSPVEDRRGGTGRLPAPRSGEPGTRRAGDAGDQGRNSITLRHD